MNSARTLGGGGKGKLRCKAQPAANVSKKISQSARASPGGRRKAGHRGDHALGVGHGAGFFSPHWAAGRQHMGIVGRFCGEGRRPAE